MAEYKGGNAEGARQHLLEKRRNQMLEDYQKQKMQIAKDNNIKIGNDKFVTQNDVTETELKKRTIGLVMLEDFQRIREQLDEKNKKGEEVIKPKKKKKKKIMKQKLSFGDFDNEEEENIEERQVKKIKLKKNPDVNTSFLPDKERDEREKKEKEKLKEKWLAEQQILKDEKILVTYSYWDGSGHRKQVECKKGDTIAQFLDKCRTQIHEIRNVNVDNLLYVKEDLIIPHHYTFYDFIVNKIRGKSGPLFSFDVHDDIRLVNDASIEKNESHAGKVVERTWYERNKHIFPASRWEVFNPEKNYGSYTIKDKTKL